MGGGIHYEALCDLKRPSGGGQQFSVFVCPGVISNAAGNKSHYNSLMINRRCAAVTLNHNECVRRAKER